MLLNTHLVWLCLMSLCAIGDGVLLGHHHSVFPRVILEQARCAILFQMTCSWGIHLLLRSL